MVTVIDFGKSCCIMFICEHKNRVFHKKARNMISNTAHFFIEKKKKVDS